MHKILIDGETISASGTFTSKPVGIPRLDEFFSLQWTITGDGTAKFEVLCSADGALYIEDTTDIITGQTKTTGPAGDGINMGLFEPYPCEAMKIKCTETGTSNSITVTAVLITT